MNPAQNRQDSRLLVLRLRGESYPWSIEEEVKDAEVFIKHGPQDTEEEYQLWCLAVLLAIESHLDEHGPPFIYVSVYWRAVGFYNQLRVEEKADTRYVLHIDTVGSLVKIHETTCSLYRRFAGQSPLRKSEWTREFDSLDEARVAASEAAFEFRLPRIGIPPCPSCRPSVERLP